MAEKKEVTVTLSEREVRFVDYALCFLLANWDEDNEEALGVNGIRRAQLTVESLKQKLGTSTD